MTSTITTVLFLVLALVTTTLQLMMYADRAKFLRSLKGQKGLFNFGGQAFEGLLTMMHIVFPIKLEIVTDEKLNKLRESALKTSRYWLISLLATLSFPIILFKLLELLRM